MKGRNFGDIIQERGHVRVRGLVCFKYPFVVGPRRVCRENKVQALRPRLAHKYFPLRARVSNVCQRRLQSVVPRRAQAGECPRRVRPERASVAPRAPQHNEPHTLILRKACANRRSEHHIRRSEHHTRVFFLFPSLNHQGRSGGYHLNPFPTFQWCRTRCARRPKGKTRPALCGVLGSVRPSAPGQSLREPGTAPNPRSCARVGPCLVKLVSAAAA